MGFVPDLECGCLVELAHYRAAPQVPCLEAWPSPSIVRWTSTWRHPPPKPRHWLVKPKPNIPLSCLPMVINMKKKIKQEKRRKCLEKQGCVLQFKIRWSGRRHRHRETQALEEAELCSHLRQHSGAEAASTKVLRWCVSMCARLSEEGEGQHVGLEAHIFCGDLVMTTFKQRRMDFAVGKSQQQKGPGFWGPNGPGFKSQFCHILDRWCPQATDLTSQLLSLTWDDCTLQRAVVWPKEKM